MLDVLATILSVLLAVAPLAIAVKASAESAAGKPDPPAQCSPYVFGGVVARHSPIL